MAQSQVTRAVIPAAGLGTRFLPATKAQAKEMLPVVDKPAIQHVVEEAAAAGLDDILIVTGRSKRTVEDHFDRAPELEADLERRGKLEELKQIRGLSELATFHYVRQGEALGLGHAVAMARAHVDGNAFAVLLPDDLMRDSAVLEAMIAAHAERGGAVLALKEFPKEEISAYGCARVEPVDGNVEGNLVRVVDIVEKPRPDEAPSNLAVLGRYVFPPEIFAAIDRVAPGVGGEIQLTDAIGLLMQDQPVYGYRFTHGRYDTGNKLDYLRTVVELAAARDDLGPKFREFLADFVRREGLL